MVWLPALGSGDGQTCATRRPAALGEPEAVRHRRGPAEQLPGDRQGGAGEPRPAAVTPGASSRRAPATAARWAPKVCRDWTIDEVHLCNIRLRLLRLNTMPARSGAATSPRDAAGQLRADGQRRAQLRELGRLPHPMLRRAGEPGFTPTDWDTALDLVAERLGRTDPHRFGGLPDQPGNAQRELLRRAEGGSRAGQQLYRQRRPDLPLAEHVRSQERARGGRHHLLVHATGSAPT